MRTPECLITYLRILCFDEIYVFTFVHKCSICKMNTQKLVQFCTVTEILQILCYI